MIQQWLNFAGLGFDFVGVIMLANEWRIAMNAERQEAEIREREHRFRPRPNMPGMDGPHQDVFNHMREDREFLQRRMRGNLARHMRQKWFTFAMMLVATGFLLQGLGSFPLLNGG